MLNTLAAQFVSEWEEGDITTDALIDADNGRLIKIEDSSDGDHYNHFIANKVFIGKMQLPVIQDDDDNEFYLVDKIQLCALPDEKLTIVLPVPEYANKIAQEINQKHTAIYMHEEWDWHDIEDAYPQDVTILMICDLIDMSEKNNSPLDIQQINQLIEISPAAQKILKELCPAVDMDDTDHWKRKGSVCTAKEWLHYDGITIEQMPDAYPVQQNEAGDWVDFKGQH